MAKPSFFHFCGSVSMIVWIPLLKKLMFRRLMTSPPSEIVTRASAIWSLSVGSVPPASADVLLRDRPVIGDVIAQLLKKRRVGVGADGDRPVRVLIDLNGVADDVLLVFYIVLIGRNRLRVQRLTRGCGIAGLIPLPAAGQGQNQRQRRTGEQTQLYHFHRHHLQRQSTGNL